MERRIGGKDSHISDLAAHVTLAGENEGRGLGSEGGGEEETEKEDEEEDRL